MIVIKKNRYIFFYNLIRYLAVCFLALIFFITGCTGFKKAVPVKQKKMPVSLPNSFKPYKIGNNWYNPLLNAEGFEEQGIASWYGKDFHGKKTASGEIYNMYQLSAAHKTLPLGTWVKLHNLNNGKKINLRINDRGPFIKGRIIDLSYGAAKKIGIVDSGITPVRIVILNKPENKLKNKLAYAPANFFQSEFTIQVAAFSDFNNAKRLKKKLDQNYKNIRIKKISDKENNLYRVYAGIYATRQQAEKYKENLQKNGYYNVFTVEKKL